MKATFFAAAAAMAGAASAAANHRHAHQLFAKRGHAASTGLPRPESTGEMCIPGCTTIWKTIIGEPTRTLPRLDASRGASLLTPAQWSPSPSPP